MTRVDLDNDGNELGQTSIVADVANTADAEAERPAHGGSSRADLQRDYLGRFVTLKPLPEGFPDDGGRLQVRLRHGWIRGIVVDVVPGLDGGDPLGDALFTGAPWALVHFEHPVKHPDELPDEDGVSDEALPLGILEISPERADSVTVAASLQQSFGRMRLTSLGLAPASTTDEGR